jgi:desulfoferrodoxin (superoxide reductase-like protein)
LVVQLWAFGSDHPEDPEHRIEWIEVRDEYGDPIERHYVYEATEYLFSIDIEEPFEVIACCNIHGLWKWLPLENGNL